MIKSFALACLATGLATLTASSGLAPWSVADKVALKARPFPLQDVRLLDGPFKLDGGRPRRTM